MGTSEVIFFNIGTGSVHPNQAGHMILARAFVQALGYQRERDARNEHE